jgi:RNA recognition motif-containing protein
MEGPIMNIFAGNLLKTITEEDLKKTFEAFGQVTSVTIVRDMFSREPKGFAFIEMPIKVEAIAAITKLNGTALNGKVVKVNEARPKDDHKHGRRRY